MTNICGTRTFINQRLKKPRLILNVSLYKTITLVIENNINISI